MKRIHIGLSVENLQDSIAFYSALFGAAPTVRRSDYAKWQVEDPRVNLSITRRGGKPGPDHFGIQVESEEELGALLGSLRDNGLAPEAPKDATCCYHVQQKAWLTDPQGLPWETFFTEGEVGEFGEDTLVPAGASAAGCCGDGGCGEAVASSRKESAEATCC